MNILALVPELRLASARLRVEQYRRPLAERGINLEIAEYRGSASRRIGILSRAGRYEAVLLHRKLLNPLELKMLRRRARRLAFDFDDAIMFRDSNSRRQESGSRRRRFTALSAVCDLIIAGNEYLAGWARRAGRRVEVIPTPVDLSRFSAPAPPAADKVVGWIGSASNLIYLDEAVAGLGLLARRGEKFVFKMISDSFRDVPGVETVKKRWSRREEAVDLSTLAIGLAPLRDDPWAKGKCAYKVIQYFAASRPVVSSPVGANLELVADGVNGYLVSSAAEWADRLGELLNSPRLRGEMGKAGRRLVEEKRSLRTSVPRMASVLAELAR